MKNREAIRSRSRLRDAFVALIAAALGFGTIMAANPGVAEAHIAEEGCTPGYWKQDQHFDSWVGYTPEQTLESVFDIPDALGMDDNTLLDALQGGGGSGVDGAAEILLRAGVAALLNASNPDVIGVLPQEVIDDVNAALASNNRGTMLALAGQLDDDNNLGCPLN